MDPKTVKDTFKLGFGLMRLPKLEDGGIDVEQVCRMTDAFIKAGGTYFDTAYVYDGGKSEEAARKALVERWPRESYTLCTKLAAFAQGVTDAEAAKAEFDTSLERTGAGYFDYYLLHALQRGNVDLYDKYGLWDYVRGLKDRGLVKNWGFSFHADPELLERLLDSHPEVDFVQLQINYADWENPGVAGRRNWEICRERGKPVTIMEPVKGGILADPIAPVKQILDGAGKRLSYAGWAVRFAASIEGVLTVLSGMSNMAQMEDNLSYMKEFVPLDESERDVIRRAAEALDQDKAIPCTGCRYCTKGCPMNIPIPDIFTVLNRREGSPLFRTRREYGIVTQGKGKASECLSCGQCEGVCPQHLPIVELLKQGVELE